MTFVNQHLSLRFGRLYYGQDNELSVDQILIYNSIEITLLQGKKMRANIMTCYNDLVIKLCHVLGDYKAEDLDIAQ